MDSPLNNHVAAKIKAARKAKGLTQEALATLIQRTPESLSNIERGQALPALDTLYAICMALEIPTGEIFPKATNKRARKARDVQLAEEVKSLADQLLGEELELAKAQIEALLKYRRK